MDINKKDVKRYLESYKRMFFKSQLDNPKSRLILVKKKEALNLKDIDINKIEKEVTVNINSSIEFVKNILLSRENFILTNNDRLRIENYCNNLNLDEDDIKAITRVVNDFLKKRELESFNNSIVLDSDSDRCEEKLYSVDNDEEVIDSEKINMEKELENFNINDYVYLFENDQSLLKENDEFFYEYLDINSKEFKIEGLKMLFFNGCLICLDKIRELVIHYGVKDIHSKEKIVNIFYEVYGDLINYSYGVLIKEKICEDNFPKKTLFEKIFGLQCLDTLIKQMNKISIMYKNNIGNEEIRKSIEKSISVYKNNGEKEHFKTTSIMKLENEMEKIFLEFDNKYNFPDVVEKAISNLFIEAMKFINKCAVANFDIYTDECGRNLNKLMEINEKIKDSTKNKAKYLSDLEGYMDVIQQSIKEYPFNENLYIELGYFKNSNFVKYDYLNKAIDIIDNSGEKNSKILEEISQVELSLYNESLSRIPKELNIKIKSELAKFCIDKFNLMNNDNVIFENEINIFGQLISDINIDNVDLELRIRIFKDNLRNAKEENIEGEELRKIIKINKEKYRISDLETFRIEYNIFGVSYEDMIFEELREEEKRELLKYCMESIRNIGFSEENLVRALTLLQEREILGKKLFREIEYKIFGRKIPLSIQEKKEIEFSSRVKDIYNKYLEKIIKLDITVKDLNKSLSTPDFFDNFRKEDEDEEALIVYSEISNFSLKKEFFVLTDKRVYSSYESNFLELKDIISFDFKSYSKVIKGERIFFEGIFCKSNGREFKLCSNLNFAKDDVVNFMEVILDSYRNIFDIEVYQDEENPIENIVGFMDETSSLENKKLVEMLRLNLEGNRFYEIMSDLLNCGSIGADDIVLEISKVISVDLGKRIFFKGLTQGYEEKISNACASYVLDIDKAEKILLVYDNSRFGSAKEGFILTDKDIYCKNRMDNPWILELKYFDCIKVKDSNKILINNRVIEFPYIKSKEQLYEMRDLLEIIIFMNSMDIKSEENEEKTPILAYITEVLNSIKSENLRKFLYMHNEGKLAEKKFNNAVNSYAELEEKEKPLLLFDSTVFAFGNSGFLVTTKNIYSKEGIGKSIRFNLGAVYKVKYKNGNFYINSVLLKLVGLSDSDKEELAEKMFNLVEYLKDNFFKKAVN